MAMFKGFKPQGLQKIASKMGYAGRMEEFDRYLEDNPEKQREMIVFQSKAQDMARGGVVRRFAEGGNTGTPATEQEIQDRLNAPKSEATPTTTTPTGNIEDFSTKQALNPTLPAGGAVVATDTVVNPDQIVDSANSQVTGDITMGATSKATSQDVVAPTKTAANEVTTKLASVDVKAALDANVAAQINPDDPRAKIIAAETTKSSVSDLEGAQGTAAILDNPVQRKIEDGELIEGVANAEVAAKYTEEIDAATATPSEKATVSGQLAELTENFDINNPPPYAAGALRAVNSAMLARGIGASSMAGQAMIQGALEAALPIAQADAATFATFEGENLSNRQERAILAAQQRAKFLDMEFDQKFQSRVKNAAKIGDIANKNFTAEQNIALENSKFVQSMNLENLSNKQAMVIAEAAALADLDTSNLSNRQAANVNNAKSFIDMETTNINNKQQSEVMKTRELVASILSDTAEKNATEQFNAKSKNQTDQFFADLDMTAATITAEQANSISKFNAGEDNAAEEFKATMKNEREQFNANNRKVIDQSNAVWKREIATADTATINRANELNAKAVLDLSSTAYANLWQGFRDDMEFAWKTGDNEQERAKDILLRKMADESTVAAAQITADAAETQAAAKGIVDIAKSDVGSKIIETGFDWAVKKIFG